MKTFLIKYYQKAVCAFLSIALLITFTFVAGGGCGVFPFNDEGAADFVRDILFGSLAVWSLGGQIAGVVFLIELSNLRGREKLSGYEVKSIISY